MIIIIAICLTFLTLTSVMMSFILTSFDFFRFFLLLSLKVFRKSFYLLDLNRYLPVFVMQMKNCLQLKHSILIIKLALIFRSYHGIFIDLALCLYQMLLYLQLVLLI